MPFFFHHPVFSSTKNTLSMKKKSQKCKKINKYIITQSWHKDRSKDQRKIKREKVLCINNSKLNDQRGSLGIKKLLSSGIITIKKKKRL